jgi:hypothetical protein
MGKFLDTHPLIVYDIFGTRDGSYQVATNVFVRAKILDTVKATTASYYDYNVQDGDTPEMLADKYYGDPELHWVILYMNDIVDPFYDWPLDYNKFIKYVQNKYGSIATAQTQVHHYEKIIERYDSGSQVTTTSTVIIDLEAYNSLPDTQNNTFNLVNGTTVTETITRKVVYAWDYELSENEKKRTIKVLRKDYIGAIKNQFKQLMISLPKVTDTVLTASSPITRLRK